VSAGNEQDLSDLAGQLLETAKRAGGADAEVEVLVERVSMGLTRFANSYIHQNVAEATTTVRLRLHLGGRTAAGSSTVTTPSALDGLVDRTLAAARLSPMNPGWPGLAPAAPLRGRGCVDERVVDASPEQRAGLVRAFVDAAGGLTTAGYASTQYWQTAFANSAGHSTYAATTQVVLDGIARMAGSDGMGRASGVRLSDVDGSVLGARAAAKARAAADPVELRPGRYEVVLEPAAVADMLHFLAAYCFNAKAVNEGRSFAELGAPQFDPAVTLIDDALANGTGLPFDVQGTPRARLHLVAAGVTAALAHDRRTAALAGTSPTGHAMLDRHTGPVATNLSLKPPPGSAPIITPGPAADSSVAALVSRVKRGILVSDHWYTRALDPKSLVVTGLTRNGVWLIENGEPTTALRDFRFTQSYPLALAPGAVLGIGTHAMTLPGEWPAAAHVAPALHLSTWHFTGGASG
jgi:predicted Zn-dependent protease